MIFIFFLIHILYILNSISPYKELNIEEKLKKEKIQKIRRLRSGKVIYKNPESIITIYNDYIIESLTISVKAERGPVSTIFIPSSIYLLSRTIISCNLFMYDDKGKEISINETNCSTKPDSISIDTNLPENYELIIYILNKGYYSEKERGFLYSFLIISIPYHFGNSTHCKYVFNVDINSVIINIEQEKFQAYNESSYFYDDLCSNNFISDVFKISARQITWNYYSEVNVEVESGNPDSIILSLPINSFGGTNFNYTNATIYYTPLKTGSSSNDTYLHSNRVDMVTYYNYEKPQKYQLIKNLTFSSCPNYWNVTDDDVKNYFKNTSTEQTIALVKEILANDTSDKPDYYKIGKWIHKNIKYEENVTISGIEEILKERKGVCSHFTKLYNALLNSIGIKTLQATGFSIKNLETLKREGHAWTVAQINGKWIGLDATWNIFSGKIPQCVLFIKFDGTVEPFGFASPSETNYKTNIINELKLIEIVKFINETNNNGKIITNESNYYNSNNTQYISNDNSQKLFKENKLILFFLLLIYYF